jgi:hypothetical protein
MSRLFDKFFLSRKENPGMQGKNAPQGQARFSHGGDPLAGVDRLRSDTILKEE